MNSSIIEINVSQFIVNLLSIRSHLEAAVPSKRVQLCLPVKANAYGHGLSKIAKSAEVYVDYLAVSSLNEGKILRSANIQKPILVFGAFDLDQIPYLIEEQLEVTISSFVKAEALNEYCSKNQKSCKVHIKVDTGLNRVGVRVTSVRKLIDYVLSSKYLKLVGVYSHLISSDRGHDEFIQKQICQFKEVVSYVKSKDNSILCYLANSLGLCYYPESYFDMVKPGLIAYGYAPSFDDALKGYLANIRSCFTLKSRVTYFKVVGPGEGISYNHNYITSTQTRIVTIAIGYGDGYRRALSKDGEVLIRGKKYKVSGNICMDMLMVDIGPNGEAYIGDEVVLIGKQGNEEITLESLAQKCDTIIYEILCGFSDRIPRVYLK